MKWISLFSLALLALVFLLPGGAAQAQATRTWISGVGSDANPCSRTAPCKTWAGAIASTAAGGEIDALDPGGFGALTITKSITLDGGGGQVASILTAGTPGITVAAASNDVVIIRNLRFDGLLGNGTSSGSAGTNGINILTAASVIVENCDIFGFNNGGINFAPTGATQLSVINTALEDNGTPSGGGGILIGATGSGTAKAVLSTVSAVNNVAGVKITGAANPTNVTVENSVTSANVNSGLVASGTTGTVTVLVDRLVASNNNVGVHSNGSAVTIDLGNSTVSGNTTGVQIQNSSQVLSYKNNNINGNGADGTPLTQVPGGSN